MDFMSPPNCTRRDGVQASSILLADGNRWGFALPTPRLKPIMVEEVDGIGRSVRTIRLVSEYGYPLEIRRHVDELKYACEKGVAAQQFDALIRLAAALICRAHDIEMSLAVSLLEMEADELPSFAEAVLSIISGQGLDGPGVARKKEVND